MASYQLLSGLPYRKHLQLNAYTTEISGAVQRTGEASRTALSKEVGRLIASERALRESFGKAFDAASYSLDLRLESIATGLTDLAGSVEAMHESLREGFGLLYEQLVIQNSVLLSIQARLDSIHKTLESPLLTQARELYDLGCQRLARGLLDKAVESFKAAEAKNDTDFFTQLRLGKLRLYGMNAEVDVVDLRRAEIHLRAACRYGRAELPTMPDLRAAVSDAYYCLVSCLYAQAGDAYVDGTAHEELLRQALSAVTQAAEIRCAGPQLLYKAARIAALLGETTACVAYLRGAYEKDRRYCVTVWSERDFEPAFGAIREHFESERARLTESTRGLLRVCEKYNDYICREPTKFSQPDAASARQRVEEFLGARTLLDAWQARELMETLAARLRAADASGWIVTRQRWRELEIAKESLERSLRETCERLERERVDARLREAALRSEARARERRVQLVYYARILSAVLLVLLLAFVLGRMRN